MSDNTSIGWALIGCGEFGRFCLESLAAMSDEEVAAAGGARPQLVAVADVVPEAARRFSKQYGVPADTDAGALFARRDVDIVHVATPPSSHHPLVLQAARADKHVLCEKPLAMSVPQADEMLEAARRARTIAPVNFVLRHNEVTRTVRRILEARVLGRPLTCLLVNCATDWKLPAGHWFWDPELSGGIFIEHGVHFFDLYRSWLGGGEVLTACAARREGTDQEDRVFCTVRHESGAVVQHFHGFDQLEPLDRAEHRLVCELGEIRVAGWIPLTVSVEAVLDDAGAEQLAACCPDADVRTVETVGPREFTSRGQKRMLTRRVRVEWTPEADKSTVYARSFRQLVCDQLAFLQDRTHRREVTEADGREALALAEAAAIQARQTGKDA